MSSRKKEKTKSDDSVVIEYGLYKTRSSSDIANTSSVKSEVKQDVEADTATGDVDALNMLPKCSFDSDIGDSNVTVFCI